MKILFKFGIGANSSTFGLPHLATPHYEMEVFKTGKIKTGFAENIGLYLLLFSSLRLCELSQ